MTQVSPLPSALSVDSRLKAFKQAIANIKLSIRLRNPATERDDLDAALMDRDDLIRKVVSGG